MRRLFLILLLLLVPALSAFRLIGPGGQYMSSQKDSKKGNVAALYGTGPRDRMIELEAGYYTLRYNCDDGLEILLISSKGVERGRFVTTGDDRGGMTWHVPEDGWYTLLTNGTSYRVDMDHGIYTPPGPHTAGPRHQLRLQRSGHGPTQTECGSRTTWTARAWNGPRAGSGTRGGETAP